MTDEPIHTPRPSEHRRQTVEGGCPVCDGMVRKGRGRDMWTCDGCARRLNDEEVQR